MQRELFEASRPITGALKINTAQASPGWPDRFHMTLRLDQLMVGGILALVLYVLVFSFGVERGKRYAIEERRAEKIKQEQMARAVSSVPLVAFLPTVKEPPTSFLAAEPSPVLAGYTIQVATYLKRKQAEAALIRFKPKGLQGFVVPKGKFFLLCLEAFPDLSQAREKLARLKADGFAPSDAYIRPAQGLVAG